MHTQHIVLNFNIVHLQSLQRAAWASSCASDDPIRDRRYHAPAILLTLQRQGYNVVIANADSYGMIYIDRVTCITCIDHITRITWSYHMYRSHRVHRSRHMYHSQHMHRSRRIHACIDRNTCIDHIICIDHITCIDRIICIDGIICIDRTICIDHITTMMSMQLRVQAIECLIRTCNFIKES